MKKIRAKFQTYDVQPFEDAQGAKGGAIQLTINNPGVPAIWKLAPARAR